MTVYQPPVGVWRSTPARRLLWVVESVLHRVTKEIPEQPKVDTFAAELDALIAAPVLDFDWEAWHAANVTKADGPDVPAGIGWDLEPVIVSAYDVAGELRAETLALPFNEADLDEALGKTMHLVRGIPDSQRDALRRMMTLALEEETGQFSFARRIRSEWTEFSKHRSEMIAVTEWNRAASQATLIGYKKTGVKLKRWFNVGDGRVCPQCRDAAAGGEVAIDDDFPGVGVDAPPGHPGCRCNLSSA